MFTGMSGARDRAGGFDQDTPPVLVDIVVVLHFPVGPVGRVGEVLVKKRRGNDYGSVRTAGADCDKM